MLLSRYTKLEGKCNTIFLQCTLLMIYSTHNISCFYDKWRFLWHVGLLRMCRIPLPITRPCYFTYLHVSNGHLSCAGLDEGNPSCHCVRSLGQVCVYLTKSVSIRRLFLDMVEYESYLNFINVFYHSSVIYTNEPSSRDKEDVSPSRPVPTMQCTGVCVLLNGQTVHVPHNDSYITHGWNSTPNKWS